MIKRGVLLLSIILSLSKAEAQSHLYKSIVAIDTTFTYLNNQDTDTIMVRFPRVGLPTMNEIDMDTTSAGVRRLIPRGFPIVSGNFDLWLDRVNLAGAADSFKVYYFHTDPTNGYPAKNDSTFLVGGASSFGNFVNRSRYTISLAIAYGIDIVIRQGDLTTVRTKVPVKLVLGQ